MTRIHALVIASCLVAIAALSCSSEPATEPLPSGDAATEVSQRPEARVGGEVDLSQVIRNAHLAFRERGEEFRGGHSTYEAVVEAGSVKVRPIAASFAKASSEMELRTVAVAGANIGAVSPVPRGGALTFDRGVGVEVLKNSEHGLEQSWEFASRPARRGEDLRVRVRVSGHEYRGETKNGLHFGDANSDLGFRYGLATWVDAAGKRTTVVPRYNRGEILIEVPAEVVDASAFPAVLDPVLGPEFGVDELLPTDSAWAEQSSALACSSANCLAVWYDRAGRILGARLGPSGTLLDGYPFVVGTAESSAAPRVASDGSGFLVTWLSLGQVYAARVSSAGVLLDAQAVGIETTRSDNQSPSVAFGAGSYLVVWSAGANGAADVYSRRVSAAGVLLDAVPVALNSGARAHAESAVTYNGTDFLIAWKDSRNTPSAVTSELWVSRRSTAGTVLNPGGKLVRGAGRYVGVDLASDGVNSLLVWDQNCSGCAVSERGSSVEAIRLGPDAEGLDATSIVLASSTGAGYNDRTPRAAYGSGQYVITWQHRITPWSVHAARITTSGVLVDAAPGVQVAGGAQQTLRSPAVAAIGGSLLFSWDDVTDSEDIRGFATDATLVPIGPVQLISRAPSGQYEPDVAFNGTNYLAVWKDTRFESLYPRLYATRITPAGAVLDPDGLAISTEAVSQAVAVASNGTDFLVIWEGKLGRLVYGTLVSAGGTVSQLSTSISGLTDGISGADVTGIGGDYLVTWGTTEVLSARVSAAGAVLDPPRAISSGVGVRNHPTVGFNGTSALVAWQDGRSGSQDVFGQRVAPDGTLVGNEIHLPGGGPLPRVVASNSGFLVAWADQDEVWGLGVSASGVVAPSARMLFADSQVRYVKGAWDGSQFVLAWHSWDLGRASIGRVTADLAPRDPAGIPLAGVEHSGRPAVSRGSNGDMIALYTRNQELPPFTNSRVYARLISQSTPLGGYCADDADCTTGHCVDAVCCGSLCDGPCEACSAALKGGGSDGVCGPVSNGADPDDDCSDEGAGTCGRDGFCDGAGACRTYPVGTLCASSCAVNVAVEKRCDGSGACADGTNTDCEPHVCEAGACADPCGANADCVSGYHCDAGACVADSSAGGSGGTGGTGGASGAGAGGAGAGGVGAGGASAGGVSGQGAGGSAGGSAGAGASAGGVAGATPGGNGGAAGAGGELPSAGGSGGNTNGGAMTSGGSTASGGTGGASSGSAGRPKSGSDERGCGCRVTTSHSSQLGWIAFPGLLLISRTRRRRAPA